jgi:hypothetical protein
MSSNISSSDTGIYESRKIRSILRGKLPVNRISIRVTARLVVIGRKLSVRTMPNAPKTIQRLFRRYRELAGYASY